MVTEEEGDKNMFRPLVDVSTWQRNIDAEKMLAAGTKAMYIKAGGVDKNSGAHYTDYRFRENANKFSHRVPCGYYYFFYPHFNGAKQARYFCNLLSSVKWNLPPAVDVEVNPRHVDRNRFQRELKAFVDVVEKTFHVKPVIYTRAMFWNANIGNPSWAGEHKLWIALYNESASHPWYNNPNSRLRPLPWNDWWLWQYSADKNGRGAEFGVATRSIDLNHINMSESEFYAFAKWGDAGTSDEEGTPEPAPAPTPQPVELSFPHRGYLRSGYSALRLRSRPTTHGSNTVGIIRRGYTFTVYKELQLGDDLWWLIELPDSTVGWGARRYQGITYLEPEV